MPHGSNRTPPRETSPDPAVGERTEARSDIAPRLVVFGASGHAACVADAALASGWQVVGLVDEIESGGTRLGIPVLPALPRRHVASQGHVVVGVGDNSDRQAVAQRLVADYPALRWATVIDPSANISAFCGVGAGAVVLAGVVIGPGSTVAAGALVNMAAVVTHDAELGPYSSVGPGATLGGGVSVGQRSAIGAGAVVREKTRIGSDSVIGAAAYVAADVADGVVCFGVPARIQRHRGRGERYLR